jgi:hypothetical protein
VKQASLEGKGIAKFLLRTSENKFAKILKEAKQKDVSANAMLNEIIDFYFAKKKKK